MGCGFASIIVNRVNTRSYIVKMAKRTIVRNRFHFIPHNWEKELYNGSDLEEFGKLNDNVETEGTNEKNSVTALERGGIPNKEWAACKPLC